MGRVPCHAKQWPTPTSSVNTVCQQVYNISFDEMLIHNPRYIAACTPHYVPPPSVLVPAIEHIFNMFGNAKDASTGAPLFTKHAWQKAGAVLELARQGYLSDLDGVVLYEQAGVDKDGLLLWKCLQGTNKVEGGPHGDIYCKFGAIHGGYISFIHSQYTWLKNLNSWSTFNCKFIDRSSYLV